VRACVIYVHVCRFAGALSCASACARRVTYPACRAHARYCIVLCGLSGSDVFFCYLINGTIFLKKLSYWIWNRILIFSITFIWNISHSKKDSARYCHKYENAFMNFLDRFPKWAPTIKFHQNPSSGCPVVPRGRTDGHDEANSRFSQFCTKYPMRRRDKRGQNPRNDLNVPWKKVCRVSVHPVESSSLQWSHCYAYHHSVSAMRSYLQNRVESVCYYRPKVLFFRLLYAICTK
jgi:hypothetical protein